MTMRPKRMAKRMRRRGRLKELTGLRVSGRVFGNPIQAQ